MQSYCEMLYKHQVYKNGFLGFQHQRQDVKMQINSRYHTLFHRRPSSIYHRVLDFTCNIKINEYYTLYTIT